MTSSARMRMIVVGVVAPLLIGLVGVIAVLFALPTLPDPIAVHWNVAGQVDGFGSVWVMLALLVVVVGGYAAFAFALTRPSGGFTDNQRMILTLGPFLAVLMTVTIAGSVLIQRGLEDAADAPSIAPIMIGGFAGALAAAVVAWWALPESQRPAPFDASEAPVLDLGASARAVWMQQLEPSRGLGAFVIGVLALTFVGGGITVWLAAPVGASIVFCVGAAVIGALAIGTMFWRVRVEESGFSVISVLGVPRFVIPLAEVQRAAPVEVHPARDFGGWGIRWGGRGRLGVIVRGGEAIEVQRTNGTSLVVTVSDATRGAALLNGLVARHASLR